VETIVTNLQQGFERRADSPLPTEAHTEHTSATYKLLRGVIPVPLAAFAWVWFTHDLHLSTLSQGWDFKFAFSRVLAVLLTMVLWNILVYWRPVDTSKHLWLCELQGVVMAATICTVFGLICASPLLGIGETRRAAEAACLALLASGALLVLGEFQARRVKKLFGWEKPEAIIVGSGKGARQALREISETYDVVGCVDHELQPGSALASMYLGDVESLPDLLKHHPVEAVVIALPTRSHYDSIQRAVFLSESAGVNVHLSASCFKTQILKRSSRSRLLKRGVVLHAKEFDIRDVVKRFMDITVSLIAIIGLSPLLLAIACVIACTSKGPVIFVQQRYGKNRRRFPIYKFRTMGVNAEAQMKTLETANEMGGPTFKMKNDPRITKVGKFLRATSLDELPQLFNILTGDMSLVGPRPLPVRDVSLFDQGWLLRRFSVKPGLTCLWQISGRSNTTFDKWMQQDLDYIDSWSLALDVRILLKTIPAVLKGSGAM
jgi:exopolysaccharide biosynthesis polyprenyl glycosylphosphotransferase